MRFWSVFMHLTRIKNEFYDISDINGDIRILVQNVRISRKKIALGNSVSFFWKFENVKFEKFFHNFCQINFVIQQLFLA